MAAAPHDQVPDRSVRVFISSTFRDMHAERDHLVTVVFPELRERVEQLGLEFFDVDLRWGRTGQESQRRDRQLLGILPAVDRPRRAVLRLHPRPALRLASLARSAQGLRRPPAPQANRVPSPRWKSATPCWTPRSSAAATFTSAVPPLRPPPPSSSILRVSWPSSMTLKRDVRVSGRPVRDYPCQWTGNTFTGMEEFGRQVLEDLWFGVLRDQRYVSKEVWQQVLGHDPDTDPLYTHDAAPIPDDLAARLVALAKPHAARPPGRGARADGHVCRVTPALVPRKNR